MPFSNPVVGGNTLVRYAIQSPDYVAGVSGWAIFRDGTAEFNNATIRGSITAGGGTVRLDAGGVKVTGPSTQYDINFVAGFLARNVPDDGTLAQLFPDILVLQSVTPTPINGVALNGGYLASALSTAGSVETPYLQIIGEKIVGKNAAQVVLFGQSSASVTDNSFVNIVGATIQLSGNLNVPHDLNNHQYLRGESGAFSLSFTSLTQTVINVVFAHAFGATPHVDVNIDVAPAATAGWVSRAINISSTNFDVFLFQTNAAASTWVNVRVSWRATEF